MNIIIFIPVKSFEYIYNNNNNIHMTSFIPISLGFLCDSRIHIKYHYHLYKENGYKTCPFDEMMSNYKGVIDCINDDFKYFCDIDSTKIKTIYSDKVENFIYNNKYNFIFNHESPGHANLYQTQMWPQGINHFVNNNYENFVIRYQKRIDNFRNYLNSGNHIIFVLHRYNNNTNDLTELDSVIRNKYPNLSFEFQLLQDNNYERIYRHQFMMGITDDDPYNESKRFHPTHIFYHLHKDYNPIIFRNFQDENKLLSDDDLKLKFLVYLTFENKENDKFIYSLKSFYENYKNFDYVAFRNLHKKELENCSEEETILYWNDNYNKLNLDVEYNNDTKIN